MAEKNLWRNLETIRIESKINQKFEMNPEFNQLKRSYQQELKRRYSTGYQSAAS